MKNLKHQKKKKENLQQFEKEDITIPLQIVFISINISNKTKIVQK